MPIPKNNQPNRPQKSKFWALIELVLRGLWQHRFVYLTILILVTCSTSLVMYRQKTRTAKMLVALNYEEATRGLYPNNTRFNISLIKSEDVLDRAIAKAGLEGQITALDMADHITALASNVDGMQLPSDTTSYKIATTYTITYEKNDELGPRISARDMLGLIVEAYKEAFYEDYTYVEVGIAPDWSECEEQEYMEIGSFFEKECRKLRRFLNTNANENGTYRSARTGETFPSLRQKVDNFISIDLEKYDSYVLQSGLSKNRERYISKLEYENFLKNIDYQKFMAEYQNRLHTIEIYDSALTAVVLIPTLDTQNNFYMSRTKVAIDYQATAAESANSNGNDTMAVIQKNEYAIRQMRSQTANTPSSLATAQSMIQDMKQKLETLIETTKILNKEYVRYKTKNYLTISFEERSLADELSLKWVILADGAAFCALCVWVLVKSKVIRDKDKTK